MAEPRLMRRILRISSGAAVAASLSACAMTATTSTNTYDLPAGTLAKATATMDGGPFCYTEFQTLNDEIPWMPRNGHVSTCAITPVFEGSWISIASPAAGGTGNSCAVYSLETGERSDRRCMSATKTDPVYDTRVDCFEPERRIPGEPVIGAPSGWRSGVCTLVVEEVETGDPVATLPLGYDRIDDARPLTADISEDGEWIIVMDTHGRVHSFRTADL
ncbi:hypothetical protein ICN86_01730 [Aquisalinus flavus]|nr:hypothetical protein [Aquisalinus flavus]MBD0425531.1 hypothetical protein [Aquisalinus flavus]